jgi:hypothetical protein
LSDVAGITEEVGKVATSVAESMKTQPLALAMVIMNVGLLLMFWLVMDKVSAARERDMTALYAEQKEVRGLLSNCVEHK